MLVIKSDRPNQGTKITCSTFKVFAVVTCMYRVSGAVLSARQPRWCSSGSSADPTRHQSLPLNAYRDFEFAIRPGSGSSESHRRERRLVHKAREC